MARELLMETAPPRWAHVQAVARVAGQVAVLFGLDRQVLVSAAWLHDVGYAPDLRRTGFHPLDGARFLAAQGVATEVTSLVANHSCAVVEARLRGLEESLRNEFPVLDEKLADALCYADMTSGPIGQSMTVQDRLSEIRERYGPDDVVTQFVDAAEHEIRAAVRRVEDKIEETQSR